MTRFSLSRYNFSWLIIQCFAISEQATRSKALRSYTAANESHCGQCTVYQRIKFFSFYLSWLICLRGSHIPTQRNYEAKYVHSRPRGLRLRSLCEWSLTCPLWLNNSLARKQQSFTSASGMYTKMLPIKLYSRTCVSPLCRRPYFARFNSQCV